MKLIRHILLFAALPLLLAGWTACSHDEDERATQRTTIATRISICDYRPLASRAAGDPGLDDELPAPTHLYVWCTVQDYNGTYQWFYRAISCTAADWVYTPDGTTDGEGNFTPDGGTTTDDNQTARYVMKQPVTFVSECLVATGVVGRIYAVAACDDLSAQVEALNTALGLTAPGNGCDLQLPGYIDATSYMEKLLELERTVFDLGSWANTSPAAHSQALGSLYSTPFYKAGAYGIMDNAADGNGVINFDGAAVTTTPTRLYHCASKVDFKWAVQAYDGGTGLYDHSATAALQASTAVAGISLRNVPTTTKIFDPTHNPTNLLATVPLAGPAGSAICPLNPGNQWIGRAYGYVLQQPLLEANKARIDYTTTFSNPSDPSGPVRPEVNASFTPTGADAVFTGWYRVNAEIK